MALPSSTISHSPSFEAGRGQRASEPRRRAGGDGRALWLPYKHRLSSIPATIKHPTPGRPERDRIGLKVITLRRKIMVEDKGHLRLFKLFFFFEHGSTFYFLFNLRLGSGNQPGRFRFSRSARAQVFGGCQCWEMFLFEGSSIRGGPQFKLLKNPSLSNSSGA